MKGDGRNMSNQTTGWMKLVKAIMSASVAAIVLAWTVGQAAAAQFGIGAFDQQFTGSTPGSGFYQAGGHPYSITTGIQLNRYVDPAYFGAARPSEDAKDVMVSLPPGLFGNPVSLPQCTATQLTPGHGAGAEAYQPECPIGSEIGIIQLTISVPGAETGYKVAVPLFNMIPPVNQPAAFAFNYAGEAIYLTGNVRNGGDFGIDVGSSNIPVTLPLLGIETTFWGVPADPSHDFQRCQPQALDYEVEGHAPQPACPVDPVRVRNSRELPTPDPERPTAFLTLPTSCPPTGVGLDTVVRADSWLHPGVFSERTLVSHLPPDYPADPSEWGAPIGTTGCELVPFNPSISVQPTNLQADTPSGLNVEISLPQEGLLNPLGIVTADVKKAVVTLPDGESVSPSAADGLGSCSLEQIGLTTGRPATCPDSSKLGTVEVDTPLMNDPLKGSIYLGKPECDPCGLTDDQAGRLVKLYIVVEGHGVILKLQGKVEMDPVTGRITTTFDNNPQLPFDHLKLSFKAGPRSPLVNPPFCGSYATRAQFTPWSGNPPVNVSSSFDVTSGPDGGPCPAMPQRFAPGFAAGTTSNQAGGFSPFSLTFTRDDGEQQLGGVSLKMPLGVLGTLTGIPLCGEPMAAEGTCPATSEIGTVIAAAGAGANPFYVTGGKIFLTAGYKGAPFGLSIVVPAVAGPFNLGIVVVRASISVDPKTAQLTISSDPLPTILDGIPLDLRTVNVSVSRSGFIFNPTNCNPMILSGTLTGGEGGTEEVSNGFQVTNCGALEFKPKFAVSTSGKTSRANGASLDAKLFYPRNLGQANIARVKVALPKQLPSRLTTLQKACTEQTFDANPAACPSASRIGTATATTPVLPVPLSGPVYFVSHGGEAFPDLVVVLQGYGVTVDLVGTTFISKAGITSTTFKTVPDVPVGTFELKLPQGRYSALAANGNLCKSKLVMPTAFVAQDGAEIHRSTPIVVSGCPKHKARKARKANNRHGSRGKGAKKN
jgi:hypothetical protein